MVDEVQQNSVDLATELTIAWLSNQNNRVSADDVPAFLRTMHTTVSELANGTATSTEADTGTSEQDYTPAVTARKSLASRITFFR